MREPNPRDLSELVFHLLLDDQVPFADAGHFSCLRSAHSRMQFAYPEIITNEGMLLCTSIITDMVVAMITVSITFNIYVFVIGYYCTTFGTGNRFYKIKTECTRITDRA